MVSQRNRNYLIAGNEKLQEFLGVAKREKKRHGTPQWVTLTRTAYLRALYGIGPTSYELLSLHDKPVEYIKNIMTQSHLNDLQRKHAARGALQMFDNKLLFYMECMKRGLSTPKVHAVINDNSDIAKNSGVKMVNCEVEMQKLFSDLGDGGYFLKQTFGVNGVGIKRFDVSNGQLLVNRKTESKFSNQYAAIRQSGASYLVQEALTSHRDYEVLMPCDALVCMRFVTHNTNEHSVLFGASGKILAQGNIIDNFSFGQEGNLSVPIDKDTGVLGVPYGADRFGGWAVENHPRHPNTGLEIEGMVYPHWEELKKTALEASSKFPEFRSVGWDIAMTENGASVIEANWNYDCFMYQLYANRGLKREFEAIFS